MTSSKSFHGNFDGGGYTISNFTTEHGFFGYVEGYSNSYGMIRNVKLDSVTASAVDDVGALIGVHSTGIVENCSVTNANVTATANYSYAGGLIGKIDHSTIENCAVSATVTGNADEVGAIIGANSSDSGSTTNYFYSNLSKAVGTGDDVGSLQFCRLTVPSSVTFTAEFENNGLYGGTITLNVGKNAAILNATNLANTATDSNGQVTFTITSDVTVTDENIFYAVTAPACVTVSGASGVTFSGNVYYAKGATLAFSAKDGYRIDKTSATVNGASGDSYTLADAQNVVSANYPNLTRVYKITAPAGVNIGGAINIGGNFYAEQNAKLTISAADGYLVENISGVNLDANNSFTVGTSNVDITANVTVGGYLDGGLKWELIDGTLTVSGTGAMDNYNRSDNLAPWSSRRAEITSVVVGSGITSVGDYAFYNMTNLSSVTLPASVTSIGNNVFVGCENLETAEVTVPECQHIVIGDKIFSNSGTVNIAEQLKGGAAFRITSAPVEEVTYTDENGKSQTVLAFALDAGTANLGNGTYVVKGNVTFDSTLNFAGDIKIILDDGATLTVNGDDYGIDCKGDLSIYGTGTLTATATDCGIDANDNVIIAGGTVTSNAEISGYEVYLDGGKVTAPSVTVGSMILLDWLNADDFFDVGTYTAERGFLIGKKFYNGDTVYSGTEPSPYYTQILGKQVYMLTADQIAALNGVKLNAFDYYTFSAPDGVDITCDGETKTLDGVTYYKHGAKISVTAPEGKYLCGTDGKFFTGSKTFTVAGDIVLTEPPTIGNLTVDADGNGTYEISTAQHLVALSDYVNAGNNCAGFTFKLTKDIDMSGVDFAPIGNRQNNFCGTFDGGGHVISNLTIDSEAMLVGLFGANEGLVQNVVLDGFDLKGTLAVAGIVAFNMGAVTNCATLGGTISGGNFKGAIVGANDGEVLNNYHYGTFGDGVDTEGGTQLYKLTLPENVTAQGALKFGEKHYATADTTITLKAANGYTLGNVTVNGESDNDGVFTVNGDTTITANVTAIVVEEDEFNAAGTAVTVKGTKGDFHANSKLYSITASQENSTLIANAKANTILVAGGNENILTGGTGNDTFKFSAGGGIVTDYGIGATKDGSGKATTANGVDVVKVDGKVSGIYFERDGNTKKSATFTATIVYGNDEVIVLKDIVKKPTKTGSSPIYQTNDVAAATLKIWDTSSGKQAVISATNLKKLFHDDDTLSDLNEILPAKVDYLVNVSEGKYNASNPFSTQLTFTGSNKH